MTEEIKILIKNITIFENLSDDETEFLAGFMDCKNADPKETILRENQITRSLFMIGKGKVDILLNIPDQEPKHIADLEQGNFFGEMSFLDGKLHSASVVSSEHSDILILRKRDFDKISKERPFLANKILSNMLKAVLIRLRDTNKKLKEFISEKPEKKRGK